jgi:hypothetical protein
MKLQRKDLVPRNTEETKATVQAKARPSFFAKFPGTAVPALNGCWKNRRNKKRPITLAEKA